MHKSLRKDWLSKGLPLREGWDDKLTSTNQIQSEFNTAERLFHEGEFCNPWWDTDLGMLARIREVHVESLADILYLRLRNFSISSSVDGQNWIVVFHATDHDTGGGLIPRGPYIWYAEQPFLARYIRVTLIGNRNRTLTGIDVFGERQASIPTPHTTMEATKPSDTEKENLAEVVKRGSDRLAVVLFVKNEVHDILAWLGWYQAIGFDSCIVYDDDSTDGTFELLNDSSAVQDIKLSRSIGSRAAPFMDRQAASYADALSRFGEEFSWIAFFDIDEYLLLNQDENIRIFLDRFPDCDAVSVNWCNYGSSGHLLKPKIPVFDAFTWHSESSNRINRHVKSIIRPAAVGTNWINVHCFDVVPSRYMLSSGKPAEWGTVPGIIDEDPDWGLAKLMHFQCRSMEHFIERVKKYPYLETIPGIWSAIDLNQINDNSAKRHAVSARVQMAKLKAALGTTLVNAQPHAPGKILSR